MITADKFMVCAKRILASSTIPEEECRTAVGRAYYSLYHETLGVAMTKYSLKLIEVIERNWKRPLKPAERAALNALDQTFLMKCNLHQFLPNTLHEINKPALALLFKNYRLQRNKADYDLKSSLTYGNANTIVSNIDGLISKVKSL